MSWEETKARQDQADKEKANRVASRRKAREKARANMTPEQKWEADKRAREASYDRQYGAGKARQNIGRMEQFARRREQDMDYIRRAEAGEVDFEGDLAEIKTGKAWEQGQIDAYADYQANRNDYKKDPTSFDYASYFPDDKKLNRRKPTYDQYMGKYNLSYDDWMGGATIGNSSKPGKPTKPQAEKPPAYDYGFTIY